MNTVYTYDRLAAAYRPLIDEVKKRMGEKRFTHTLSVAKESVTLAGYFVLSQDDTCRLFVASLLHDITKAGSFEEQACIARELDIPLSEADLSCPPTLHALTGAAVAQRDFSAYADAPVLSAIRSHTVGGERMTPIDKLLFLADYIEETRTHPICIQTRKDFYKSLLSDDDKEKILDRFVLLVCRNTVSYLAANGLPIHPTTLKTIESLSVNG